MDSSDSRVPAPAGTLPSTARRWWVLAIVSTGQLIIALDATVVSVMGPALQADLGLDATGLQWVFNNYIILFGGLLLLGGRLTDVIGRRVMFVGGLTLFAAASLAAALADTETQLLVARAVQGFAAAGLSPACLSILVVTFPDPAERARAFGVWGAVLGLGAGLGTLLGGALVDVNWRLAFYINLPVAAVLLIGAYLVIRSGRPTGPRPETDVAGGVTGTIGLAALVLAIVSVEGAGWTGWRTIAAAGVALVLLPAFVLIESRASAPLLPLGLFRRRTVVSGSLGEFFTAGLMMPMFLLLPIYMQTVLGYSPLGTGVAYIPTTLAMIIVAAPLSRLLPAIGPRVAYLAGVVCLFVMLVLAVRLPVSGSYWMILLPITALLGVGLVLCLIPTPAVGTARATEADAGTTSAVLNVSTQVGGALGLAIAATVVEDRLGDLLATGENPSAALTGALHGGMYTLFVWLGFSFLVGLIGFRGIKLSQEDLLPPEARAAAAVPAAPDAGPGPLSSPSPSP
jgi:EmrB/QacA subfamily drug resistance transporter